MKKHGKDLVQRMRSVQSAIFKALPMQYHRELAFRLSFNNLALMSWVRAHEKAVQQVNSRRRRRQT